MYAIVRVGGKQYRVERGDSILVDRLRAGEGDTVALEPLLVADGERAAFEGPELERARVEAVVAGHERGQKIHVLKFKPKRRYKRRQGHRSELTRLEIGEIEMPSKGRSGRAKRGAGSASGKQEGSDGS